MKNLNFFLFGIFLIVVSCKQRYNYVDGPTEAMKVEMSPPSMNFASKMADAYSTVKQYNPKLIKKGSLTISSSNIEFAKGIVYDFVKKCNGQIISESLTSNEPYAYYEITLTVQASLFDRFFNLIDSAKLNIISKSFSSEDVTMQYIDNTTRLENKKKLEKRYLELLGKTKDIKDMLDIEEKLENIRSDIESRESQMKVMETEISYSEINLKIEKQTINLTYEQKSKYSFKVWQGIISGWQGLKATLIFLLSIWPVYLIVIAIYYLVRYLRHRRKK